MSTVASVASGSPRPPASSAQRTQEAKDAFTASLNAVGASIDAELHARAKSIHDNAKVLTKQEDDVRKGTKGLAKENDSLQKLVDKTKKEMQSLGDLDDIMANIDADMALIEDTLRIAEEDEVEHARKSHVSGSDD
ncbi:uncharacterized protein Z519_08815 [Cladophialophora bantiana CBS 173.52]|uniref:Uncharacterized protein n=1 Tax=Cladophialophora bantiana (strain ATCC 10958 / CBS 173.52 / CDC B-1940 / NIH 8579) TaxID=1442370 RepID=A0A0D2FUE6_CLAB1|nr:uncharacterized protein Z519_08815 [Cladophialophora bantiana CBS 173.52]KIW90172.1 hypothetical protein Z519_08815 [Cladophialophora bantiana CBS 173.52]